VAKVNPLAKSEETWKKLWDASEELTKKKFVI